MYVIMQSVNEVIMLASRLELTRKGEFRKKSGFPLYTVHLKQNETARCSQVEHEN